MEESNIFNHKSTSKRHVLQFISKSRTHYEPQQHNIDKKMNDSFSPNGQKWSRNRSPLHQIKRFDPSNHLMKNCNPLQKNILRHKIQQLKISSARKPKGSLKTQLIIDKPHYLQYFRPKTFDQILEKYQNDKENGTFHRSTHHKHSFSSVNFDRADSINSLTHSQIKMRKTKMGGMDKKWKKSSTSESMSATMAVFNEFNNNQTIPQGRQNKQISLYCKRELECYYKSLIKFSGGDTRKYKEGLQSMLNLMNVPINQKVLSRQFNKFKTRPSFDEFVEIFTKIVDANLRQNVMDFFDIIFEECGASKLDKQELTSLLCKRMNDYQANEITDEIFDLVGTDYQEVSMTDIFTLCITKDDFCMFMKQFGVMEGKNK